jgi:hypothetical protein
MVYKYKNDKLILIKKEYIRQNFTQGWQEIHSRKSRLCKFKSTKKVYNNHILQRMTLTR